MIDDEPAGLQPATLLLVCPNDWLALTLGTVLRGWGFRVARAATAGEAVTVDRAHQADAVLVDLRVPAEEWSVARRALEAQGGLAPTTPMVRFTANDIAPPERLEALATGAWDVVQLPLDTAALRLRLGTWVRAKRHADALDRRRCLDDRLPVYNTRGLLRRARELGAESARAGTPLACVAFGVESAPAADAASAADGSRDAPLIWDLWRASSRESDVFGRVGESEFVVLAPRTDAVGGRTLVARLQRVVAGDARLSAALQVLEPAPLGSEDAVALVSRTVALLPGATIRADARTA